MNYSKMSPIRYLFYTLIHPETGFEEMLYNRKGSVKIAAVLTFLFFVVRTANTVGVGLLFGGNEAENANIWLIFLGSVGLILVFSLSNWLFCTLLDGSGKLRDIWTVMSYAMLPYIILSLPLTLLSRVFTLDEAVFYHAMMFFAVAWSCIIGFTGLRVVHEFTIGKTIVTVLLSVIGIAIILFLMILLLTMFQSVYSFVATIVNELQFRAR